MDGGDPARTLRHDEGATAPVLEFHQQHCSPSFAAAVAHASPPRVQPLTPLPPPQPPRLGAHLGAQPGDQLGAQLGGQSEDMPEQQSQDWPDGLLPAVPPRAAAVAAHGRRLPPEQYPSLVQGAVPLPPNRSESLDHFLDHFRLDAHEEWAPRSQLVEVRLCLYEKGSADRARPILDALLDDGRRGGGGGGDGHGGASGEATKASLV